MGVSVFLYSLLLAPSTGNVRCVRVVRSTPLNIIFVVAVVLFFLVLLLFLRRDQYKSSSWISPDTANQHKHVPHHRKHSGGLDAW